MLQATGNSFWNGRQLQGVPAGRADVFQDRSLSLSSKRMLMRFLRSTQEALEGRGSLLVSVHCLETAT